MQRPKYKIELLAPAKDKNCAITAINCGADAIYIGAQSFGARKNAPNSLEDIKEVIDYAHIFGVKIFITINTVLFDNEINYAKELIQKLYDLKADAIIIQDMGLVEAGLAPISLHASTQCHNSTTEKVKFLEDIGFQRAILARELSLEEIKNIAQNTTIELETFVLGALCVSYSGQCYMSYVNGGRSANRGECAQPCRKKYSLIDADGKFIVKNQHLLCLKDFNASQYLEQLINAGVSSFKIEGRLKDENYIKNTVSFYRAKLDKIIKKKGLEKTSYGVCSSDFCPNLNKTFNRGFCSYFLNGRNKDITSFLTPKNIGEPIGTIKEVQKDFFVADKNNLNIGDGITFFNKDNELCGAKIDKIINGRIFPNTMKDIKKGLKLYKNYDVSYIKQLEKSSPKRKLPINISFNTNKDNIILKIEDFQGQISILKVENSFPAAQNKQKAKENLAKQLSKLGNSEFILNHLEINGDIPFIKINEINDMRRKLVYNFRENLIKNYSIKKQSPTNHPKLAQKQLDYSFNITNEKAKSFYAKCGANTNEYGLEHNSQNNYNGKIVMTTKHCLKFSMGLCSKSKSDKLFKEPFFLVDETNKKYRLEFDCKNCLMKIKA